MVCISSPIAGGKILSIYANTSDKRLVMTSRRSRTQKIAGRSRSCIDKLFSACLCPPSMLYINCRFSCASSINAIIKTCASKRVRTCSYTRTKACSISRVDVKSRPIPARFKMSAVRASTTACKCRSFARIRAKRQP